MTFYNSLLAEVPLIIKAISALPLGFIEDVTSAAGRRTQYAEDLLGRYQRYIKSNPDCKKPMLLSRELKARDAGQISYGTLVSDAEAMILGGSDTTAITLAYLIWAVTKHPSTEQRLVEEVNGLPYGFKGYDLKRLPYLNQVIDEALRLYGAAPAGLPRTVPAGGRVLCEHFLPDGVSVTTHAYTLHRDPKIFPEPEKLVPYHLYRSTELTSIQIRPLSMGKPDTIYEKCLYAFWWDQPK